MNCINILNISMMYECNGCNYITDKPCNLERHNNSKKHNKMVLANIDKNKTHCKHCNKSFTTKTSMYRHIRLYCKMTNKNMDDYNDDLDSNDSDNNVSDNENNIVTKTNINKQKDKISISMDEYMKLKQSNNALLIQNEKLIDLASKTTESNIIHAKSTKKSINMMSHAIKHFANAPPMKKLEGKHAMKLLSFDNKSKYSIEDIIIYHHHAGTLQNYFGDMLVKEYKTKNPDTQSIWTTDTSRLCFIIKQIIKETGDDKWMTDRSGITLTKLIIFPLLAKVKDIMTVYIKTIGTNAIANCEINNTINDMKNICYAQEIMLSITKQELDKNILKYIAPHFGFEL